LETINIATGRRTGLVALVALAVGMLTVGLVACSGGGGGGGNAATPNNVPRFAYAANYNDKTVSIYTVNAATGQLRHNGYAAAGSLPYAVAADPFGKFVYVVNYGSGNVSGYTVNATTGALTSVGAAAPAGNGPMSVTVDPSGKFVYVANNTSGNVSGYTINALTGVLTQINCGGGAGCNGSNFLAGTNPLSVTVGPSGKFAYVVNVTSNDVSAYTINTNTGVLTQILCGGGAGCNGNNFLAGSGPYSVTVDPSGKFAYVANWSTNNISAYTINATTGALTGVGAAVAAGTSPHDITVDPSGKFAYVANLNSSDVSAYTINTNTGVLTQILCGGGAGCNGNNFLAGTNPYSVTVDPSGKFAYAANVNSSNVSVYSINASTGALTVLPTIAGRSGNIAMAMTRGATAVSYTPKFAYAANYSSNDVSAYTVNAGTGALTPILCGGGVGCNVNNFSAGTGPGSVTADLSGKFAYVANGTTNDVSAYTINATTGALTPILCGGGAGCNVNNFAAGFGATSVTVDPSGKFAYVANAGGNVSAYTINAATGALSQVLCGGGVGCSGNNFTAGTTPVFVTVDPAGKFAYVANQGGNSVSAYTINAGTGVLTSVGPDAAAGATPKTVTVDPTGKFAYAANSGTNDITAYTINATTGVLTQIFCGGGAGCNGNNFLAGGAPYSVTVDPTGKFAYVANRLSYNVSAFTINATTGALTEVSGSPYSVGAGSPQPYSVTVDPSGKFVYTANASSNNVSAFTINVLTGGLSSVGAPTGAGSIPLSVTTTGTIQ